MFIKTEMTINLAKAYYWVLWNYQKMWVRYLHTSSLEWLLLVDEEENRV